MMMQCGTPPAPAALQALQTTYGVDIDGELNVPQCRERILKQAEMTSGEGRTDEWVRIVNLNIIQGDALDPKTFERFSEHPHVVEPTRTSVGLSEEKHMSPPALTPVVPPTAKKEITPIDVQVPVDEAALIDAEHQKATHELEEKVQALMAEKKKINATRIDKRNKSHELWYRPITVNDLSLQDRVHLARMLNKQIETDTVMPVSVPPKV
jgi:hypothetical protein